MAQALCENDHPLVTGESCCPECGARIKMQWMSNGSSPRIQPKSDVMSGRRFALFLALQLLLAALLTRSFWDQADDVWSWVVPVLWFGIFIPLLIWDWRREVRKAKAAEPAV